MEIISRVRFRIVLTCAFLFLLLTAYSSFAKSAPPSLDEVLKKPAATFSWSNLVFGFFALSLSTLTIAKAYEIFKKTGEKKEISNNEYNEAEIESLKCKINEISTSLCYKNEESQKLRDQILLLEGSFKEKLDCEELLKKSISSLRKECEKLIAEKEKLNLEISRKSWEELFQKNDEIIESAIPIVEEKIMLAAVEIPVEVEIPKSSAISKVKAVPAKKKTTVLKNKKLSKAKSSFNKKRSK